VESGLTGSVVSRRAWLVHRARSRTDVMRDRRWRACGGLSVGCCDVAATELSRVDEESGDEVVHEFTIVGRQHRDTGGEPVDRRLAGRIV